MCLAVPGKIVEIAGGEELERMGMVDFSGVRRMVSLAFVPEAQVGDWVIVHTGYALTVLDESEAQSTLSLYEQITQFSPPIPPEGG